MKTVGVTGLGGLWALKWAWHLGGLWALEWAWHSIETNLRCVRSSGIDSWTSYASLFQQP